jgi:hypothetical protein
MVNARTSMLELVPGLWKAALRPSAFKLGVWFSLDRPNYLHTWTPATNTILHLATTSAKGATGRLANKWFH